MTEHLKTPMNWKSSTVFLYMTALIQKSSIICLHGLKFHFCSPGTSVAASAMLMGLIMAGRAAFVFPLSFLTNLAKKSPTEKISIKQQVCFLFTWCYQFLHLYKYINLHNHTPNFRLSYGGLVSWEVRYLWHLLTIR